MSRRRRLPSIRAGIGAALSFATLRVWARNISVAALVKTVVAPLLGLLLATALGLSDAELRMALIFLACPPQSRCTSWPNNSALTMAWLETSSCGRHSSRYWRSPPSSR
jgi:hypothetical protein